MSHDPIGQMADWKGTRQFFTGKNYKEKRAYFNSSTTCVGGLRMLLFHGGLHENNDRYATILSPKISARIHVNQSHVTIQQSKISERQKVSSPPENKKRNKQPRQNKYDDRWNRK